MFLHLGDLISEMKRDLLSPQAPGTKGRKGESELNFRTTFVGNKVKK